MSNKKKVVTVGSCLCLEMLNFNLHKDKKKEKRLPTLTHAVIYPPTLSNQRPKAISNAQFHDDSETQCTDDALAHRYGRLRVFPQRSAVQKLNNGLEQQNTSIKWAAS